jgi:hypothetical protein
MVQPASVGLGGPAFNSSPMAGAHSGSPLYAMRGQAQTSPMRASGTGYGGMPQAGETPQRNFRQVFMQPWTTADQVQEVTCCALRARRARVRLFMRVTASTPPPLIAHYPRCPHRCTLYSGNARWKRCAAPAWSRPRGTRGCGA